MAWTPVPDWPGVGIADKPAERLWALRHAALEDRLAAWRLERLAAATRALGAARSERDGEVGVVTLALCIDARWIGGWLILTAFDFEDPTVDALLGSVDKPYL